MEVKVLKLKSNAIVPKRALSQDVGADLYSVIDYELQPLERKLIPTGIALEIPEGYEGQVRPKSGIALKHGVTVLNTPGTIEPTYRGEVGVILINLSDKPYQVRAGEKIAQLVIKKYELIPFRESTLNMDTERGAGGFGSTGVK